jgi:tetratricopeptide (TPR) repeat protein
MADKSDMAWDYYLQGFRLHNRLTKEANREATKMFQQAIRLRRDFARAYGHLSYTLLVAWQNDWIDPKDAQALCAKVMDEIDTLPRSVKGVVRKVRRTRSAKDALDNFVEIVVTFYAAKAVGYDEEDYDNHWSLGSAHLISRRHSLAIAAYDKALALARAQKAPLVNQASLQVDRADALFLSAGPDRAGQRQIARAINDTQDAMKQVPNDPKRQHWNWTLGWAYYEAGDYVRSLDALLQFRNPPDAILKNLIATYVALGLTERAQQVAKEFLARNPNYDLSLENRRSYRDSKRRQLWKSHLRAAGLPEKGGPRRGTRRRKK